MGNRFHTRQIVGLGLHLSVEWVGLLRLQELIVANLHSKQPMLFYYWYPDKFSSGNEITRLKFLNTRKTHETTGACDFPVSKLSKLVKPDVQPIVKNFSKIFNVRCGH